MRALIIRHAETTGQAPEAPLSERGFAQADALVPVLTKLGAGPLYTSPFARAHATLAPFAEASGQALAVIDNLRERLLAPDDDANWRLHLERSFADDDYAGPGGESINTLRARLAQALTQIETTAGKLPTLVSHGGAISALFAACDPTFGEQSWQTLRNPDLFDVTLAGGAVTAFTRIDLPTDEA